MQNQPTRIVGEHNAQRQFAGELTFENLMDDPGEAAGVVVEGETAVVRFDDVVVDGSRALRGGVCICVARVRH